MLIHTLLYKRSRGTESPGHRITIVAVSHGEPVHVGTVTFVSHNSDKTSMSRAHSDVAQSPLVQNSFKFCKNRLCRLFSNRSRRFWLAERDRAIVSGTGVEPHKLTKVHFHSVILTLITKQMYFLFAKMAYRSKYIPVAGFQCRL